MCLCFYTFTQILFSDMDVKSNFRKQEIRAPLEQSVSLNMVWCVWLFFNWHYNIYGYVSKWFAMQCLEVSWSIWNYMHENGHAFSYRNIAQHLLAGIIFFSRLKSIFTCDQSTPCTFVRQIQNCKSITRFLCMVF